MISDNSAWFASARRVLTNFGDKSVVRGRAEPVSALLSPKFEGGGASRSSTLAAVPFPAASPASQFPAASPASLFPASQFPVGSSALPFPVLLLGLLRGTGLALVSAGVGVGLTNFGDKSVVRGRTELVPALLSPKFGGGAANGASRSAAGLALAGAGVGVSVGVGVTNFGDKSVVRRLSESVPVLLSPKFGGECASRAGRSARVLFPAASPASQFPVASSALPFPALLLGLLRGSGLVLAGAGATNFGDKSVVRGRTEPVPALLSPKFEGRGGNAAAIPRLPAVGAAA